MKKPVDLSKTLFRLSSTQLVIRGRQLVRGTTSYVSGLPKAEGKEWFYTENRDEAMLVTSRWKFAFERQKGGKVTSAEVIDPFEIGIVTHIVCGKCGVDRTPKDLAAMRLPVFQKTRCIRCGSGFARGYFSRGMEE